MERVIKQVAKTQFEKTGVLRKKYVTQIEGWLTRPEIIIIKGIRRAGKSTILQQIAARQNKKAVYINFDHYRLLKHLSIELLEKTLELFPDMDYYFFDEIQKVPGFESWLRTYYDIRDHKKFIISGSNISMLTPQLATKLTGRNITFEVFPLDYEEFKTFTKGTLEEYQLYGGFPEIALEQNKEKKEQLITQYFNDILLRDIYERFKITPTNQFKELAQYIITNTGLKISANKLAKELGVIPQTAEKYLSHLIDAYLIFEVPYFSYSAKTKYTATRASKYYCIDNGLVTALGTKINKGHLFEAIIAQTLRRNTHKTLYYWTGKQEVDFIQENNAYQVSLTTVETKAFEELQKQFKHITKTTIVTPKTFTKFCKQTLHQTKK